MFIVCVKQIVAFPVSRVLHSNLKDAGKEPWLTWGKG